MGSNVLLTQSCDVHTELVRARHKSQARREPQKIARGAAPLPARGWNGKSTFITDEEINSSATLTAFRCPGGLVHLPSLPPTPLSLAVGLDRTMADRNLSGIRRLFSVFAEAWELSLWSCLT